MIIAMLSVSISPILVEAIFQNQRLKHSIPGPSISISLAFWRMLIGAILLWSYTLFNKQKPISFNNRNYSIVSGVFLALHFYFFFEAIRLSSIANATFLGTLAPIFTLIFEIFLLKRKISFKVIIPLIVIIIGSAILVFDEFNFSTNKTIGNLFAILCSFWFGICFIISDKVRKTEGTINYTKILYTSSAVTLFFIAFFYDAKLFTFSYQNFLLVFLLGVIPNIFGHNLLYYSVKYISPTIVSCIPLGEPVIASIFAYILFNQTISISGIFGGGIILVGLFFLLVNKTHNVT